MGGLESFPTVSRDSYWDADADGIADWWDGSTGGEGYTPLDGYLNWMAEPHIFASPGGTVKFDVSSLAVGFLRPQFQVTAEKGRVSLVGGNLTYTALNQSGLDTVGVNVLDSEGSAWYRSVGVAVFEGYGTT